MAFPSPGYFKPVPPPTGAGLIGQTGNKPGGSVAGSVLPPREGLYDPRPISGPEIERREDSVMFWLLGFFMLTSAVIGFILGRIL